jgi:hypothetical protein
MKKKIISALLIAIGLFSFVPNISADVPDPVTLEVTSDVLDTFDPLIISGSAQQATLSTPGGIISRALEFIFPIAGLALFIMIVAGGLQILAGASNSKALQEGQKRVTMAIVGFLILFASYWIAQILEIIFGVTIL